MLSHPLGVIEENKQRPMNEPCPLLKRLSGELTELLSMVSFSPVRSSMAASQFYIKISEASFPQSELKAFLTVAGTNTIKK